LRDEIKKKRISWIRDLITKFQNFSDQTANGHFHPKMASFQRKLFITFFTHAPHLCQLPHVPTMHLYYHCNGPASSLRCLGNCMAFSGYIYILWGVNGSLGKVKSFF
jgi:hypothetical protein